MSSKERDLGAFYFNLNMVMFNSLTIDLAVFRLAVMRSLD